MFVISVYQYLWKGSFIEIHDVIVLNRPLARNVVIALFYSGIDGF